MQKKTYTTVIVILLIIQTLIIVRNIESEFFSFFWYCDFIPGVMAVAFLTRNVQAVKGILNVGFFAQLGYSIAVIAKVFLE